MGVGVMLEGLVVSGFVTCPRTRFSFFGEAMISNEGKVNGSAVTATCA